MNVSAMSDTKNPTNRLWLPSNWFATKTFKMYCCHCFRNVQQIKRKGHTWIHSDPQIPVQKNINTLFLSYRDFEICFLSNILSFTNKQSIQDTLCLDQMIEIGWMERLLLYGRFREVTGRGTWGRVWKKGNHSSTQTHLSLSVSLSLCDKARLEINNASLLSFFL